MADLTGKLKLDTSDFNAKADAAAKKAGELGDKTQAAAGKNNAWGSSFDKVSLALTGINQGMQIAGQVIQGLEKAYDATAGAWTDYADSMRLSAQMAGVNVEEMSKLVQAADDFRVPIETMQRSMEMALKNGFVPTIENLANLSDELLAIVDPAERAEAASKIFGKSYADMMPFLLAGGDAIRGATAAVSANLIVTKEAAAQAKAYKDQVDALGDAWTGLKNVAGQAVVPALTEVTESFTTILSNGTNLVDTTVNLTGSYEDYLVSVAAVNAELKIERDEVGKTDVIAALFMKDIKTLSEEDYKLVKATEQVTSSAYDFMTAQEIAGSTSVTAATEAAAAWDAYVAEVENITSLTANFGSIITLAKNYDKVLLDITDQTEIMAEEPVGSEKWLQAKDNVDLLKQSMTDLANQMTLDMLQAAIAIGGITSAEAAAYFQMAADMGIISEDASVAAIDAYGNAVDTINGMTIDDKEGKVIANTAAAYAAFDALEQYALLDKEQRVFVRTYTVSGGYDYNLNDRASGGPVYTGQNVRWGEYGPETFVAAENGRILSRADSLNAVSQASGGGGGGGGDTYNYNLTMPTTANPNDVKTAFELMEAWA